MKKLEIGTRVIARPRDLGRDLGYYVEGFIVQVERRFHGSGFIYAVKYDTGKRGSKKFSNYFVTSSEIVKIFETESQELLNEKIKNDL